MKCAAGIAAITRLDEKILINGPMILINRTPNINRRHTVDDRNPLISASTISPMYIGSIVNMAPSVIPIINLKAESNQMFFAKAIPKNPKNVRGASNNIEFFLPIRSAILAANTAPIKHPINMDVAHHVPWDGVVGIVEEFDKRYGRYGDDHPELTPNDIVDKDAERRKDVTICSTNYKILKEKLFALLILF